MPKKYIKSKLKKYNLDPEGIRNNKSLRIFGTLLHDPNLFHLNRRSIAGAFAVGLFFSWVPVPFQMALAAAAAIPLRVNLPVSVAMVWVSNPATMPVLYPFAYVLGTWILGIPVLDFSFELSFDWLKSELLPIWQPFLLGCFVLGVTSASIGYGAIRLLWRWNIVNRLQKKQKRLRDRIGR